VLCVLAHGQLAAAADEETYRLARCVGLDQLGPGPLLGVPVVRALPRHRRKERNGFDDIWDGSVIAAIRGLAGSRW